MKSGGSAFCLKHFSCSKESGYVLAEEPLTIRPLFTLHDMHACERLQTRIWQYSDLEVVPHSVFLVAQEIGGEILGAFDGDQAVGFTLAFPAVRSSRVYLHSHMTAVLPEYQNKGVGRSLKLAQREHALMRRIDLIEWTFDPLQLRNAYFNVERLGAIARRHLPNFYGHTSSTFHRELPTDRLVAEWRLESNEVKNAIGGRKRQISGEHKRVYVPPNISELCMSDPQRAQDIQRDVRSQFQQLFQDSYAVTGFGLESGQGIYFLESHED